MMMKHEQELKSQNKNKKILLAETSAKILVIDDAYISNACVDNEYIYQNIEI